MESASRTRKKIEKGTNNYQKFIEGTLPLISLTKTSRRDPRQRSINRHSLRDCPRVNTALAIIASRPPVPQLTHERVAIVRFSAAPLDHLPAVTTHHVNSSATSIMTTASNQEQLLLRAQTIFREKTRPIDVQQTLVIKSRKGTRNKGVHILEFVSKHFFRHFLFRNLFRICFQKFPQATLKKKSDFSFVRQKKINVQFLSGKKMFHIFFQNKHGQAPFFESGPRADCLERRS